ncbi:hypothetical protein [Streptomyces sp. AS02]|nr:hypothetical protein [Streptomyces sp. AS02]
MSFHKIAPVKKNNCKTGAPARKATKPAPKKAAAPKRRPIAPKG